MLNVAISIWLYTSAVLATLLVGVVVVQKAVRSTTSVLRVLRRPDAQMPTAGIPNQYAPRVPEGSPAALAS